MSTLQSASDRQLRPVGGEAVAENQQKKLEERIEKRIKNLGPWFHNMRLGGVQTAPQHFLGDYPQVKYERFRQSIAADLSGKRVLDIGCNAGFYSLEMKRRG